MNIIITIVAIIAVFSILGFLFRSAIKLFLALGLITILFTLFFSDGTSIINKITPFLEKDAGQKVEEFYAEFKSKADEKSVIDADKLISSIKDYVAGAINKEKLKEDLRTFTENNLTEEKLNEGVNIIEASIEAGTITEDLINFALENFTAEKANAFLDLIRSYINY